LGISVVGYNLTNPGTYVMPLMVAGGLGYGSEFFSIEADASFDFTSYEKAKARIGAGAEVLLGDHFPVRGGYRYDQARGIQSLSVGSGYLASEFAVDAALRVSVVGQAAMAVIIGLRYHLDGAGIVGASDMQ
jgi:opacity protein-like surface antigen